jgi:hypothetical protein
MKDLGIPFDGFGSVVEMLKRSDSSFREKILTNIRKKDPRLAQRLENNLRIDVEESSRAALERGKRAAFARNYGN